MKKISLSLVFLLILSLFTACNVPPSPLEGTLVEDALGNAVLIPESPRVVSCYGSFADCWLLSGGSLVGVTEDAVEEGIVSESEVTVVGSVKSVNLEQIIALDPDFVILSADLAAHLKLRDALEAAKIPHGYFRVDSFSDYKALMAQFCAVNHGEDAFERYVTRVESDIRDLMARLPSESDLDFLLVRVYSTGMKAKTEDNLAGQILAEFALHNVASQHPSLLEDLSVEQVIRSDPDFIFALAMGSEDAAEEYLRLNVENNPAWSGLSAVKNGNYHLLPKDLFHYKPNERWAESYEYLAKIIYPEIFE